MTDVVIIGAGPAGLSAAITCARHNLKVRVLDEFMKPGGRLLGQLHQEPDGTWWNGIEEAQKLFEQAVDLGIRIECGVSVSNIEPANNGWNIFTKDERFHTPILLLATGAAETPLPVPGWTLPGVMSIGAAQVMTNVHRVKVGKRGVIIGVNILSVAITRELQLAGIDVAGMYLPGMNEVTKDHANPGKIMQSLLRAAHLAPSNIIRLGSKWMKNEFLQSLVLHFYPKSGVKMWGIPIFLRTAVLEIIGDKQVEGVRIADISPEGIPITGTEKIIPVDFVCIAGGLYPLAELAAVAGCPFHYIKELGGHVPLHNEKMETPLAGLFVTGNITGIESAKIAKAQGVVAGLSIVNHKGGDSNSIRGKLEEAIRNVEVVRHQALIQFHPDISKGRSKLSRIWSDREFSS